MDALDTIRPRRAVVQLAKFALVGAAGYAINLAVFEALVSGGLHYLSAAVLAFGVAVTNNYLGNRLWTFRERRGAIRGECVRFVCVSTAALLVNLLLLHALVVAGLAPLLAQAVAIVLVTPLNFLGNRLWSFRSAAEPVADAAPAVLHACPLEDPRAVICLPVYNERENLEPMLRALGEVRGPRDVVLVIDDASPDGTGELAERLARDLGFVDVLHRPAKEGLGRAYVAGFRTALERGAELVVELDADFSHDPADVPRLVAASEEADVVIGSRYVRGGDPGGLSPLRRLLSRGGCAYAGRILGLRVRDLTGGFKCYRRRVLERIGIDAIASSGYAFQIETTYRAAARGFAVAEVPISFGERAGGESKMSVGIALEALWRVPLLRLAWVRERLRETARAAAYKRIVLWWALSRTLVLGATVLAQAARWPRSSWYDAQASPVSLLHAWDGRWYRIVAERGYLVVPGHQNDTAFFPLYPVVLRELHRLGLSYTAAGALVSNLAFLVGLVALYELARIWLPEDAASRSAVYAAIFPFGFVFSMLYPEGLVLAAMALAAVLAWRGRWTAAAIAAAVATLGRPEGVFLALPLAELVWRRWDAIPATERPRALTAVLAAPVALTSFAVYDWLVVGDPIAFSSAQRAWGRWFSPLGVSRAVHELTHAFVLHREWLFRDAAFAAVYVVCIVVAARAGVPRGWILASLLIVLLPLESGSVTSDARFGLLALPVYAGLGWAGRRRWLDLTLRLACPPLLALSAATILLHWP